MNRKQAAAPARKRSKGNLLEQGDSARRAHSVSEAFLSTIGESGRSRGGGAQPCPGHGGSPPSPRPTRQVPQGLSADATAAVLCPEERLLVLPVPRAR